MFRPRLLLLLLALLAPLPAAATDTLVLGIFAYRPKEIILQRFQGLADYLGGQLGDTRVELRTLKQDEIETALANNELDLLFTNPSHYVVVRSQFQLTGALATLVSMESGRPTSELGGVVFARSDSALRTLGDLRHRRIAVPGTKYLGGYQTQAYELQQIGIDLQKDALVREVGSHDDVIKTVLAGEADAGFIRTGLIEEWQAAGKLDPASLLVINGQHHPDFPYRISTRRYPEWAFVALPHVGSQQVRKLAAALMSLEAGHPAARAAGIAGFAPPADYLPVENIMRSLHSPPFDRVEPITLRDIWQQHRLTMLVLAASIALVSMLLLQLIRRNRQLQAGAAALEEARRAAEAANIAKSRFLATMSHEIRTPMNGILGMAQILQMPGLSPEEQQEYVRTILNSGTTLLTLLNDILDLSKVEAGKLELKPVLFSPGQLLDEMATLFAEPAAGKGLDLQVRWHGAPGQRYLADTTRLRQMMANLLSNAIKFSTQGQVRLDVAETDRAGSLARLEFAVTDSGIGIPTEKLASLFQPFTQINDTTTREHGGTGLGLSIIKSLARLMDGEVGVSSEPGKGSRFWFTAWVEAVAAAEDMQAAENGAPLTVPAAAPRRPATIMVAEDNPTNRKVIAALIDKLGLQPAVHENGKLALDAIKQGATPDLVLMDVQMPVMDGLTATRLIRAWETETGRERLPIIAVTAGAFEDDQRDCIDAGMDDFLTKPIDAPMLRATLDKWLS